MVWNMNAGMHGGRGACFSDCTQSCWGSCHLIKFFFYLFTFFSQVHTCVLPLLANKGCLVGHHNLHGSYTFSISKVECVCSLPSSVLRERAGRGGEEGEAVIEEESQTGDQSRQDREQSSGELTPAAANLPLHQGNAVFLSLSLKMCSSDFHPKDSTCLNWHISLF